MSILPIEGDDEQNAPINEQKVKDYVNEIKSQLGESTLAWQAIAAILVRASDDLSDDPKKMAQIFKETGISKGKASKLLRIGKSDRLKRHKALFERTTSWTVLYGIEQLDEDEFDDLIKKTRPGMVVSEKDVAAVRKRNISQNQFTTVVRIELDVSALKSGGFGGHQFQRLMNIVNSIQKEIPFLRVVSTSKVGSNLGDFEVEIGEGEQEIVKEKIQGVMQGQNPEAEPIEEPANLNRLVAAVDSANDIGVGESQEDAA